MIFCKSVSSMQHMLPQCNNPILRIPHNLYGGRYTGHQNLDILKGNMALCVVCHPYKRLHRLLEEGLSKIDFAHRYLNHKKPKASNCKIRWVYLSQAIVSKFYLVRSDYIETIWWISLCNPAHKRLSNIQKHVFTQTNTHLLIQTPNCCQLTAGG